MEILPDVPGNATLDILLPHQLSNLEALAEHAASVALHNFEWRYITLVLFLEAASHGVSDFARAYRSSLVLGHAPLQLTMITRQFVLYGNSSEHIARLLQLTTDACACCDNTGMYLIVCVDPECDEAAIMQLCWRLRIVNVVFIKNSNVLGKTSSFTYLPFEDGKCEEVRTLEISKNNSCINGTCYKGLYPEKFKNLHMCPIIVSTFQQAPFMFISAGSEVSGAEGELLLLLAELLNANVTVVQPPVGEGWGHMEGDDWKGSLGDVYHGRANLSLASIAVTVTRFNDFHVSFPFNSIDLVWVTAPSALKPGWEKLMYPYEFRVNLLLGCMFLLIAVFNTMMQTRMWKEWINQNNMGQYNTNFLFVSCAIFLGMPVTRLPTKAMFSAIFLLWVWFTFIIRTGYQAALIGSLKVNVYEKDYEHFEAAANEMSFGGVPPMREYFQDDPWILKSWTYMQMDDIIPIMTKLSRGELKFIFAINKELALEFLRSHKGTYKLQIIPEKIVTIPTAIFFKKYSHLSAPMSHLLSTLNEAGLWQRLMRRYAPDVRTSNRPAADVAQPLDFANFAGCWVIITAGWVLGLLFFVVEVLCGRFVRRSV